MIMMKIYFGLFMQKLFIHNQKLFKYWALWTLDQLDKKIDLLAEREKNLAK